MTEIRKALSFADLSVRIDNIGEDFIIMVSGGEAHVGSCVMAIPRPSLADPGKTSCTSSVINVTGHKDEFICRKLAETVCHKTGRTTVCTGGFHFDDISETGIREVMDAVDEIINIAF